MKTSFPRQQAILNPTSWIQAHLAPCPLLSLSHLPLHLARAPGSLGIRVHAHLILEHGPPPVLVKTPARRPSTTATASSEGEETDSVQLCQAAHGSYPPPGLYALYLREVETLASCFLARRLELRDRKEREMGQPPLE